MTPASSLRLHCTPLHISCFSVSDSLASFPRRCQRRLLHCQASNNSEDVSFSMDVLEEFIKLNVGCWTGSFTQYDALGNALHDIPTRMDANSYGRGDQVSLYQTLSIKQAPSKTFIAGEKLEEEDEWAEFKLDETNRLTIDRQQQVGYFPKDRAYTVSHRTAEMLDRVIRAGVLGEDGDDLDDVPLGVKLPSRRPALVCESCLYTERGDGRVRGFHVLDPKGLLDFIGVFQEKKDESLFTLTEDCINQDEPQARLVSLLGCWSGHSVTKRTGVYGSTIVEDDITVTYNLRDDDTVTQEIKSSKGTLHSTGVTFGNLLRFDKGLQMTLLPGGLALTAPMNVGRSVGRSQAFYFEFSWVYSPGKRRRLVRTYDTDGLVVSSTFVEEVKL